jgi:hypothetical protein
VRGNGRLPREYSKQLRRKFGLWPSWLPDSATRIGDFGPVRNGIFERQGHLADLAVEVSATDPRTSGDLFFASNGTRQIIGGADGAEAAAPVRMTARIEFTKSFDVFVGLRQCAERRLADPLRTAAALDDLCRAGEWRDDLCVVTGVVDAAAALIAVGSADGGTLELSGAGPTPDLLGWVGADLQVVGESRLAFRALLPDGCSPLFRLAKLAGDNELVPRGGARGASRLLEMDPRAEGPD